jgi:hypothetical protein
MRPLDNRYRVGSLFEREIPKHCEAVTGAAAPLKLRVIDHQNSHRRVLGVRGDSIESP